MTATTKKANSQLVTINDAANLLAVKASTIRKWLYQRRLDRVKLGRAVRLRLDDVERLASMGLSQMDKAI